MLMYRTIVLILFLHSQSNYTNLLQMMANLEISAKINATRTAKMALAIPQGAAMSVRTYTTVTPASFNAYPTVPCIAIKTVAIAARDAY